MSDGVGVRSDQTFLFARKKNKADAASRPQACGLDGAKRIDHQSRIASVIERPCTQFPRIEMCAKNYELVRFFAAAYLGNHVARSNRSAHAIGNCEVSAKLLSRSQQARHAIRILARYQHRRNGTNFALQRIRVAIEQVMRARGLKSEGQSLGLPGTKNN